MFGNVKFFTDFCIIIVYNGDDERCTGRCVSPESTAPLFTSVQQEQL